MSPAEGGHVGGVHAHREADRLGWVNGKPARCDAVAERWSLLYTFSGITSLDALNACGPLGMASKRYTVYTHLSGVPRFPIPRSAYSDSSA